LRGPRGIPPILYLIFMAGLSGCGSKQKAPNKAAIVPDRPEQQSVLAKLRPAQMLPPAVPLPRRAAEEVKIAGPEKPIDRFSTVVAQREAAASLTTMETKGLNPGGSILVELREALDSDSAYLPPFVAGLTAQDVVDASGKVLIPIGSHVVMTPRVGGKNGTISGILLALFSVDVNGKPLYLTIGTKDTATAQFVEESSNGPGHRNVHLSARSLVKFKIHAPVDNR
jgi:hypothetical protein